MALPAEHFAGDGWSRLSSHGPLFFSPAAGHDILALANLGIMAASLGPAQLAAQMPPLGEGGSYLLFPLSIVDWL